MNVRLSQPAIEQLAAAPVAVQKTFIKQISFLARNLGHPSLHAKKYEETKGLWQARVNHRLAILFHHRWGYIQHRFDYPPPQMNSPLLQRG